MWENRIGTAVVMCVLVVGCGAKPPPTPAPSPKPKPAPALVVEKIETQAPTQTAVEDISDAGAEPACPAPEHGPHCLWMATNPPNPVRAQHVARRMKADGYDALADGDRVIVHADDAQLKRLFGSEIPHERRASSSSDRMRCTAALPEGAKLAPRYRGEVGAAMLDDPTCEL